VGIPNKDKSLRQSFTRRVRTVLLPAGIIAINKQDKGKMFPRYILPKNGS
jgi:hypothetical protein